MRKRANERTPVEHRQITLSRADTRHRQPWQMWQRATEVVTSRVARDVAAATGLSGADYGVLSQLTELGRGTLRQQDLADAMGWHKSRLSHHLSRMELRALVRRNQTKANNVRVLITPVGTRALRAARPVQASAVKRHLMAKVPPAERRRWLEILARLGDAT
jgi:DNA-binding MarR family transcriptional regulator